MKNVYGNIFVRLPVLLFFVAAFGILGSPFPFLTTHACVWADEADEFEFDGDEFFDDNGPEVCEICDPLEPVNRFFFQFNDKLYFWALKPVAQGYAAAVPEVMRNSIKRSFKNLLMPVRLANNLLQANIKGAGEELSRFLINSTVGVLGMADPAREKFDLQPADEDLGQTLGVYGVGNGIFICWPFLGPSTLRDTVGLFGDSYLNPLSYLYMSDSRTAVATFTGREVNNTSLSIGDYENFIESAFDPYIALRDAYVQYRRNKVKNSGGQQESPIAGKKRHKKQFSEYRFSIQVGAYHDSADAGKLAERLRGENQEVDLVEYKRGDYSFYGVQIPIDGDFVTAKLKETDMVNSGFLEAFVVAR